MFRSRAVTFTFSSDIFIENNKDKCLVLDNEMKAVAERVMSKVQRRVKVKTSTLCGNLVNAVNVRVIFLFCK